MHLIEEDSDDSDEESKKQPASASKPSLKHKSSSQLSRASSINASIATYKEYYGNNLQSIYGIEEEEVTIKTKTSARKSSVSKSSINTSSATSFELKTITKLIKLIVKYKTELIGLP